MVQDELRRSEQIGHESLGTNFRGIWRALGGLSAIVVGALLAVAGLLRFLGSIYPATSADSVPAVQVPMPANVPELNPDQPSELRQLRQREEAVLNAYQWIDKSAGTARIPIQRAMQIIATGGLPAVARPVDSATGAADVTDDTRKPSPTVEDKPQ